MGCISKILELKGDREIFRFEESDCIVAEGGGIYKGYEFLITFVDRGHRCGYVAIDSSHPLYGIDQTNVSESNLSVHGGITFHSKQQLFPSDCEDEWLGFDTAHYCDDICTETAKKYFPSSEAVAYYDSACYKSLLIKMDATHKSYGYVESECKNLIDQLVKIKEAA